MKKKDKNNSKIRMTISNESVVRVNPEEILRNPHIQQQFSFITENKDIFIENS